MMPSYPVRLLLLASASFFLVQILVAAVVALAAPAAIRRAGSMRPHRAAGFLLTLRLLPAAFSAMVVAALCVPSYLRFEPRVAEEQVGALCVAAAILGAAFCAIGISRSLAALIRSSLFVRRSEAVESNILGERVWVVRQRASLALAGILSPRLLISERALHELSEDQLSAALRHEHAHRASRDNLKRLLILLAPPVFPRLRLLEQAWAQCAEWAADDRAADGNVDRSTALAEALVRVARLQQDLRMPPLVTSLVGADEDLSLRVDRLLESRVYESQRRSGTIALSVAAVLVMSLAINAGSLRVVHDLLERLLD